MKVFRFMSKKEFDKLIKGEELINNTKHEARTNSIGFCFMKLDDNTPEYAYKFLSGVVDHDVCVIFETKKKLVKSYGVYADPYGSFFDTITEDEYCIKKYSLNDFKILKVAIPDYFYDWKWETDLNKITKKLNKIEQEKIQEEKERKIKNELKAQYKIGQEEKLLKFYNEVQEKREIEIKIDGKYYKIPANIVGIEHNYDEYNNIMRIEFETWLTK